MKITHTHRAMRMPHTWGYDDHTHTHRTMKTLHTRAYEDTIVRKMFLKVLQGEKSRQKRIKKEVWSGERKFE